MSFVMVVRMSDIWVGSFPPIREIKVQQRCQCCYCRSTSSEVLDPQFSSFTPPAVPFVFGVLHDLLELPKCIPRKVITAILSGLPVACLAFWQREICDPDVDLFAPSSPFTRFDAQQCFDGLPIVGITVDEVP